MLAHTEVGKLFEFIIVDSISLQGVVLVNIVITIFCLCLITFIIVK